MKVIMINGVKYAPIDEARVEIKDLFDDLSELDASFMIGELGKIHIDDACESLGMLDWIVSRSKLKTKFKQSTKDDVRNISHSLDLLRRLIYMGAIKNY